MTEFDPDFFEKVASASLEAFHDAHMSMYGIGEKWADLTDTEKLGFAVEVVDMVLCSDSRIPVKEAWHIVYGATKDIYPPIPLA